MFNLTRNSKVYIVTPYAYASGGPELLHQLCSALCQKGINAQMVYYDRQGKYEGEAVPKSFKKYGTKRALTVEDSPENVIVVPESVAAPALQYCKIQKCIWWLGLNNSYWINGMQHGKIIEFAAMCKRIFVSIYQKQELDPTFVTMCKQNAITLAQSWNTVNVLQQKGLRNIAYLSDYISDDFVEYCKQQNNATVNRENLIVYNPSRNQPIVKLLIQKHPEINFMPIKGMTQQQMIGTMEKAKIYIDLGTHPGKDRMPREAALCGCCILVAGVGSADLYDDMPIASEYKFKRSKKSIVKIEKQIKKILENYELYASDFDDYRSFISNEKVRFLKDVDKIFTLKEKCLDARYSDAE